MPCARIRQPQLGRMMYVEMEQPEDDGCQPPRAPVSPGREPGLPPCSGVGSGTWSVTIMDGFWESGLDQPFREPRAPLIGLTVHLPSNPTIPFLRYIIKKSSQVHKGPWQEM